MEDFKIGDLVTMRADLPPPPDLDLRRMIGFPYRVVGARPARAEGWGALRNGVPAPRQWIDLELAILELPGVPRLLSGVASSRLRRAEGVVVRHLQQTNDAASGDPKKAVGSRKPDTWNVPDVSMYHMALAMDDGARKYGRFNWRQGSGVNVSTYINAMQRHLAAFKGGENTASDSGVHHLAHLMASAAIVLDAAAHGKLIDDRGPPSTALAAFFAVHTKKG